MNVFQQLASALNDTQLNQANDSLYRKQLKGNMKLFRNALRDEIVYRAYRKRVELRALQLRYDLGDWFDIKEALWKMLRDSKHRQNKKLPKVGRIMGQIQYDFSPLSTNLFSVDAVLNIVRNRTKLNTDEHCYSLHANAGPEGFYLALEKDIKFDIPDLAKMIYKNIQTVKTTVNENILLSVYHRSNKMVNPQVSYTEVGISPLVHIPHKNSFMKDAWINALEYYEVDHTEICHPFTSVLTLDQAIELYPEIAKINDNSSEG